MENPVLHIGKKINIKSKYNLDDCISGVIVSVFTSIAIDCGFEPQASQTKIYKTDIFCFFLRHA